MPDNEYPNPGQRAHCDQVVAAAAVLGAHRTALVTTVALADPGHRCEFCDCLDEPGTDHPQPCPTACPVDATLALYLHHGTPRQRCMHLCDEHAGRVSGTLAAVSVSAGLPWVDLVAE